MKKKIIGLVLFTALYAVLGTSCRTLPRHAAPPKPPGAPAPARP